MELGGDTDSISLSVFPSLFFQAIRPFTGLVLVSVTWRRWACSYIRQYGLVASNADGGICRVCWECKTLSPIDGWSKRDLYRWRSYGAKSTMATKSDRSLLHVSEPPDADPPKGLIRITVLYLERHVRWCGERERKAPVYPIIRSLKWQWSVLCHLTIRWKKVVFPPFPYITTFFSLQWGHSTTSSPVFHFVFLGSWFFLFCTFSPQLRQSGMFLLLIIWIFQGKCTIVANV
jgi:hypothetical protein